MILFPKQSSAVGVLAVLIFQCSQDLQNLAGRPHRRPPPAAAPTPQSTLGAPWEPGLPDASQMPPICLPDASRCSRCLQMPPDASRCLQMPPDASQMPPDVSRCLPDADDDDSRCLQMLPRCSRCLPDASQMPSRCVQMLPYASKMSPDASMCLQDASRLPRCLQMPPRGFPDASQMLPDASICLQDASRCPRCLLDASQMPPRWLRDDSQMLPDVSRCLPDDSPSCLQMLPYASKMLPRCFQMPPRCLLHDDFFSMLHDVFLKNCCLGSYACVIIIFLVL